MIEQVCIPFFALVGGGGGAFLIILALSITVGVLSWRHKKAALLRANANPSASTKLATPALNRTPSEEIPLLGRRSRSMSQTVVTGSSEESNLRTLIETSEARSYVIEKEILAIEQERATLLSSQVRELIAEIESLHTRLQLEKRRTNELEEELEGNQQERGSTKAESEFLSARLFLAEGRVNELNQQVETLEREKITLHESLESLQDRFGLEKRLLESEIDDQKAKVEELSSQLNEMSKAPPPSRNNKLSAHHLELEQKVKSLEGALHERDTKIEGLMSALLHTDSLTPVSPPPSQNNAAFIDDAFEEMLNSSA